MAKTRPPFWTSAFRHSPDSGRLGSKVLALETVLSSRTWQWSALTVLCLLAMACEEKQKCFLSCKDDIQPLPGYPPWLQNR